MKTNFYGEKANQGFSFIEMLVAVSILVLAILSVVFYMRSGITEEAHLDARARALQNYTTMRTFLRQDVLEAYKIEILNENSIKLYLLEVDESFAETRKEVLWSNEGTKKVVRTEAGKKRVFDFSDSLDSHEVISIKFAMSQ
ncbi:MAG: PulJ/GspJ family protein [Candidatus Rifleibacteriota bacterium]